MRYASDLEFRLREVGILKMSPEVGIELVKKWMEKEKIKEALRPTCHHPETEFLFVSGIEVCVTCGKILTELQTF